MAMQSENENGKSIRRRAILITVVVCAAAALRIIPHPMNFTPIGALALFCGAYFSSKRAAVAIPLLSLIAGDVFVGFHPLMFWVYASFLVSVAIGFWLRRKKSVGRVEVATVAGAIQFFVVTNFAVWATSIGNYPKNASGLVACYLAGLPLLGNTLAGDSFYVALLFGGMALMEKRVPSLREPLATEIVPKSAFR
jgi:hypothetical protein